jgi:subtilase family serine protease
MILIIAILALPSTAVMAGPPDAAVSSTDIAFSNDFPKTGEIVTINVTVHNFGGMDSGAVTVKFFVDSIRYLPDKAIGNIPVNGTGVVSTSWPATIPKEYTIKVVLECAADTNVTNNEASRTITVGAPAGPLIVNMALDPSSCKPEQVFWANGTVKLTGQPISGAQVTVTVKPSGTPAAVTADADGRFSANLTAPKTAGRFEVEASATSGTLKGNDTKTLSVVLPDLDITALTFSNDKPVEGDNVKVTATVKNIGNDSVENFNVAFYFGSTKFTTVKAGPLPAGNQTEVAVDWKAVKGTHEMKAVADPDNKVAEVNEEDNALTVPLTVKEKPGAVDSTSVMLIVAVVVVAVAAVAVIWVMRARKKNAR